MGLVSMFEPNQMAQTKLRWDRVCAQSFLHESCIWGQAARMTGYPQNESYHVGICDGAHELAHVGGPQYTDMPPSN